MFASIGVSLELVDCVFDVDEERSKRKRGEVLCCTFSFGALTADQRQRQARGRKYERANKGDGTPSYDVVSHSALPPSPSPLQTPVLCRAHRHAHVTSAQPLGRSLLARHHRATEDSGWEVWVGVDLRVDLRNDDAIGGWSGYSSR